jgi:phospholipase C
MMFWKAMRALVAGSLVILGHHGFAAPPAVAWAQDPDASSDTTTPIRHLVVIIQENCSFDHYFATYPHAANPPGEPPFHAKPGTPAVNGLSPGLLAQNPNLNNPFRLDRSHAVTGGNTNDMLKEQSAFDGGLMDKFVQFTGTHDAGFSPGDVMGYFDGNTVTGWWNYAQHFAMSDNFFGTTCGATILGHVNIVSGQTHGAVGNGPDPMNLKDGSGNWLIYQGTLVANTNSDLDHWATKKQRFHLTGKNVGDLLRAKGVTWGYFSGGFHDKTSIHPGTDGVPTMDYGINREPFQLYASTANPDHVPPASAAEIGHDGVANHQYDLTDFQTAITNHTIPAVTFLKAPNFETGHPGTDSTPLEEQTFLVNTLNQLQRLPEWRHTAVFITYDDSDGWYDHQMPPIVNHSMSPLDALLGTGNSGPNAMGGYPARCGYGPRLPFLVVSPFAKPNYVDHGIADQSSILRFIEDNWSLGRIGDFSFDAKAGSLLGLFEFRHGPREHKLFLDPSTGVPMEE